MPDRSIDANYTDDDDLISTQEDDLTSTQEFVIAGVVILLFGLLYWFLNHGWNSDNTNLIEPRLPPVDSTLTHTVKELPATDNIPATEVKRSAEKTAPP